MVITEEKLIKGSAEDRKEFLNKTEVLDKVKNLILLPNTEIMTTKMVAEWFEAKDVTIKQAFNRNKEELTLNGVKTLRTTELQKLKSEIQDVTLLGRANAVTVYSKRALLNMAMLLTESDIARRVRTSLLDQQEVLTVEQKLVGIDEERELVNNISMADNALDRAIAISLYREHTNKHKKELEDKIEMQQPMVDFHNQVSMSSDTNDIINVAKIIDIGRNKFMEFLRSVGILFSDGKYSLPKQVYQDQGYFEVSIKPYETGSGYSYSYKTTVTGKGKVWLHKIVDKYGGSDVINKLKMNDIEEHVKNIKEKKVV